ncbi:MAG: glucose-6-phosphate dehydrogenase, partial [Solirubrobacterales bacterium]
MSERQDPVAVPADQVIVLFGATGDLAKRKLLPGMFHLAQVGLMPGRFRIVGAARRPVDVEEFRRLARESVDDSSRGSGDGEAWERFAESLRFAGVGEGLDLLAEEIARARGELGGEAGLLFYLSLPPQAMEGTVEQIGAHGLGEGAKVITEKPFGTDLDSARKLNRRLHGVFAEDCIFRIDHYIGREAVQNLLALRFANGMFEPVWNRNHIDHVQIDV